MVRGNHDCRDGGGLGGWVGVVLFGGLGWIALLVVWGAPPFCPPRLPSPWPSPAERERGNVRLRRSMWQGLFFSGWAFRPLKRPRARE